MSAMSVEKTLNRLQRAVRLPSGHIERADYGMTINLLEDLATEEVESLVFTKAEVQLLAQAELEVSQDLRFEHLSRNEVQRALRRFICVSNLDQRTDHVARFIGDFGRELQDRRCYFPLLHMVIPEPYEIGGALFLPLGDERIPPSQFLDTAPPCGGVVLVPTRGTDPRLMMKRGRDQVQHALRILRVGLREHNLLHDWQLRFRLGDTYALDKSYSGSQAPEDTATEGGLTEEMRQLIEGQALSSLPYGPRNDMERKAKLALKWADRARMATDPVEATLYLFFALEALLGDKAEGLKAFGLIFRRTVLGHAVTGYFSSPSLLYYLYDKVRSVAVHGGEAPEVTRNELVSFEGSIRRALNEYLTFAQQHGLTKQSQVRRALTEHEDAAQVLQWLRNHDPRWQEFNPLGAG
jgi:hypothetical protein